MEKKMEATIMGYRDYYKDPFLLSELTKSTPVEPGTPEFSQKVQ